MTDHLAHSHNQHARPDHKMGRRRDVHKAEKKLANAKRRRRDKKEAQP